MAAEAALLAHNDPRPESRGSPPAGSRAPVRSGKPRSGRRLGHRADGSVDPVHGARTIWWDVLRRVPALEDRLGEFAGLAGEWEDATEHRSEFGNAIVDAASRLIADSPEP
jgi:hypothetical protein